jgi:hypothetical protein
VFIRAIREFRVPFRAFYRQMGRKNVFRLKAGILIIASIFLCAQLTAQEPVQLSVKKIELYKNGMGYFEHLGTVKGTQSVEITLTTSQLNDVLKSLTILDLGRGQIGSVNYDSTAPMDRRLAEVPIDLNSAAGIVEMLNQLRGAGLEIRTPGGVATGKLMGAELRSGSTSSGAISQHAQISLFKDSGEVQLIELESAGALKFTDQRLAGDLGRYLDLLNTTHQRDIRRLQIKTIGTGERQIFLSYTSESPIWKTTYRIVLDPKQKTLLQGWAIVDNTTPMDWRDVSLSLVSGAPISFVQNLSQPLYAKRPVVPLAEGIQVNPQVYESAIEIAPQEAPQAADIKSERKEMEGGFAEQTRASRSFIAAPPPAPQQAEFDRIGGISNAIRQQITETAQAQAAAEQFEYKIRQPVTIRRNESALLPIIQSDIDGEKVSIYKLNANETHPRLAFWLKNVSGLTLDAGPVTIIDSNTFAGEGLIEAVQPGESRLLSYAIDLGTEISTAMDSERQRVERVLINQGMIRMFSKLVEKKTYKIRNNNETPRSIVLEHPVRPGWKLVAATPAETTANYYRFKVESRLKSTVEFTVQEEFPLESSFAVSSITPDQIAIWIRERSIDPETEKLLRAISEKKNEINDLSQQIASLDKEQNDIFKDQERVRGNLQRLGQNPEEATLRQRYIRQLETQENRLSAMKTEREKIDSSRTAAQKQLDAMIQKISVDKKL